MSTTTHQPGPDDSGASAASTFRPRPLTPDSGLGMDALRWFGALLGTLVVFVLSVVLGVFIHANTPPARRLATSEVNAMLAPSFKGRIRIDSLGELGLFGFSGANVTVDDPAGRPVIVARGVRVRVATLAAVRSALFGKRDPLAVELSDLSIDTLDVRLDTDPRGQLDLVDAFELRTPAGPADPSARGLRIAIPGIAWRHAWAHGQIAGLPPLDADVDDVRGAFTYAPDSLEVAVSKAKVAARRIANGADLVGSLEGQLEQPSGPEANLDVRVTWNGVVAGIEHWGRASLVGDVVDAVIDVPQAEPANIRALWPASPIQQPLLAHLEAHGTLDDIDLGLHARLGDGALDARGRLSLGEGDRKAKVSIEARDIDIHQLAASAPTTRIGLVGDVNMSLSAARQLTASAYLVLDEPGAAAHLDLRLFPKGASSAVGFELDARSADLVRVPQLEHAVRGSLTVSASGELDIAAMTVEGRLRARADAIARGTTRIASASLEGRVRGAVAGPHIDAELRSQGIVAGPFHFASASVSANGSATRMHVSASARGPDTPDIDALADVDLRRGVLVDALRVDLSRDGERGIVTARQVSVARGALRVDEGRIEGIGAPLTATVRMTPGMLSVRATTQGIDLARVARLANLETYLKSGTLAFDTDLRLRRESGEGRATLDLTQASFAKVTDVSAHVEVALDGRKVAGRAHVQAKDIGSVDIDAPKLELAAGGPLAAASWRNAWGVVDVDGNADLARMADLIPADLAPAAEARGNVVIHGHLARDDIRDITPDLTLSVTTDHLNVAARTPTSRDMSGVIVHPLPAWHLAGLDFVLTAEVDGDTGLIEISTQIHDTKGPLARLDASTAHFPYADVFHATGRLATSLRTTPFDAHLVIPERGLGSLPQILKQHFVTGKVQADVTASGTLLVPTVNMTAAIRHANFSGTGLSTPLDVDVTAHYDGARGNASIHARSADHVLLGIEAQADASIAQFLDAGGDMASGPAAWKASVRAHLAGFPMGSIAALDDRLVAGRVSGDVSLVDLHENAQANVALVVDALSVGSVAYKSASIQLKADGRVLDAAVHIDQTDGFVDTKAHGMASWGAALLPALDRTQPLTLALSAKNFRIAALQPFVAGTLDELDGRLDADTHVELDPVGHKALLSGTLALSRGTMEAAAGGGEFHDIAASVRLAPDGTVTLEKLTAKGLTGQLEATGAARLDGTTLQSARAIIVIPSRSPIPLSTSETEVGNVDGRVEISELTSEDGKAMDVKVEVPQLRVALPEGSSTDAQALGPMAKVRIGAHRGDPHTFVLLPLDPVRSVDTTARVATTKLTIEAHLGDVEVVRGTQLKIDLSGHVTVVSAADPSQVTGQIHLKHGGVLDVQGRKFMVEDGTVTLVGSDPSNPEVVVKASWTAPDGTVVYATFNGPLKTGKVTLSAEPTLPQQEIVELLLFGTTGGRQAQTATGTSADSAMSTAGGEAAQPLNHALGQLGLGAVSANIDSTQGNPRPEVEVQIAKDISIQIAVVLGQPPPGVNPDHTLLTVDWRFLSRWSLASTVGDAGTTIFDLLWQRRY
jgi:translocation and assembly module TamB